MAFSLISEDETKVVSYTTEMQSIGFGFSATDMRRYVFYMAKINGRRNPLVI
jgi:hypothetical protein